MEYSLLLEVIKFDEYLEGDPTYVLLPATASEITRYLLHVNQAVMLRELIPGFARYSVVDHTPALMAYNPEPGELEKLNLLPSDAASTFESVYLIPTSELPEDGVHQMRVDVDWLNVSQFEDISYNGYLRHSNIGWETVSLSKNQLFEILRIIQSLPADASDD